MNKRPCRDDGEDDILRYQDEFFAKHQKPSVTVVKKDKSRDVVDLKVQGESEKQKDNKLRFRLNDEDFDAPSRLDAKDKEDIVEVLSSIKEKDITNFPSSQINFFKNGFPKAPLLKSNENTKYAKTGKKKSLFAQQFSSFNMQSDFGKQKDEISERDVVTNDVVSNCDNIPNIVTKTNIEPASNVNATTQKEATLNSRDKIHEENMEKLNNMSEMEIMEEQKRLFNSLDPKMISFLKKKKNVAKDDVLHEINSSDLKESIKQIEETVQEKITNTEVSLDNNKEGIDPYKEFGINKNLIHMGNIEREKLSWMKDLPKLHKHESSSVPRFDFSGKALSSTVDIPVNTGLHHHGNEPLLPGYTLEELFHMARSNFTQQRVIALQTLSRIIESYHYQEFSSMFTTDLLTQCLEAGLLFILRWSLDEQSEQIYSATLQCLANILYIKEEQSMLDKLFMSSDGCEVASLCTYYKKSKDEMTQEEVEEDRDLNDAEIINKDLIKGLLQIQTLPRIRYLMDIPETSDVALVNCLKILIRVAQHNSEASYAIFKCRHMLTSIMKLLQSNTDSDVKCHLLILIKALCLSGKNLTLTMISEYGLEEVIERVFASSKDDTKAHLLFTKCCQLWVVLLHYGFSAGLIKDFYPLLMNELQHIQVNYNEKHDQKIGHILLLVEAAILCAKANTDPQYWSIVDGFYQIVYQAVTFVCKDMLHQEKVTHPLIATMLVRCCTAYFQIKNSKVGDIHPVELVDSVSSFHTLIIHPMTSSQLFHHLLSELVMYSDFKALKDEGTYTSWPINLPTHGLQQLPSLVAPSLMEGSPLMLTQALVKLMLILIDVNKNLISKASVLIKSPGILLYLSSILQSNNLKRCSSLLTTTLELSIIEDLLKLFVLLIYENKDSIESEVLKLYLQVAHKMISKFHLSQEDGAIQVMKNILFNPIMYRNSSYILWTNSSFEESNDSKIKQLMTSSQSNLLHTGSIYEHLFFGNKRVDGVLKTTFLKASIKNSVLPSDWMYYPVIKFHNLSMKLDSSGGMINKASNETVKIIKHCLQFILLLELSLSDALAEISETTRLTRLFCVFLTEGRLFAEDDIEDLLYALTFVYSAPAFQLYLNFEEKIPGVNCFFDIYCNLVEQYQSASFGDSTFANLLLIPMQLKHDVKYRKAIWTDYCDILRIFPITIQKISTDMKWYFAAECEDIEMIEIYMRAILTGSIKPTWCPFFYLIAVHHVNQFIFQKVGEENVNESTETMRHIYLKKIINMVDKELKDDVIRYDKLDLAVPKGFNKYTHMPPTREIMLRNYNT